MQREPLPSERTAAEPPPHAKDPPRDDCTLRSFRKRYSLFSGIVCLFVLSVWTLAGPPTRPSLPTMASPFDAHGAAGGQAPLDTAPSDAKRASSLPSSSTGILTPRTVQPFTFAPLPLGSIKPQGWLKDQLQLAADGLAGHEMDFYDIVRDNPWLGGRSEYSPLNEALPYWFNGVVPLAYGLGNARLRAQVRGVLRHVLEHRDQRGWIGPETDYDSNALWGRFPFALGLMQMAEADPDERGAILDALHAFIPLMQRLLDDGQSDDEVWGRARHADMVIVLQWLYAKYPRNNGARIVATMRRLEAHGADWQHYFTQDAFPFQDIDTMPLSRSESLFTFLHAVNAAQGLKAPGVAYRLSGDRQALDASLRGVNWTLTYHGAAHGAVVGDERMSGLAPNRGTELCSVVELLYSLTHLHQIAGAASLADAAERAAFNALPPMLTPDHWAHQYINLPNQPAAAPNPQAQSGLWWNVNTDGLTFAVEPNYPCCAVNFPQGWPKLLAAAFAQDGDNGLAHAILVPASVATTLPSGNNVSVECTTTYPFGQTFSYAYTVAQPFTLATRLPAWHPIVPLPSAALAQTGGYAPPRPIAPSLNPDTRMTRFDLPAGRGVVTIALAPPALRTEARANDTVAVFRGALLYALDLGETTETRAAVVPHSPPQAQTVFYRNARDWNVAIDPAMLRWEDAEGVQEAGLPNPVWAYRAPPGKVMVKACRIEWPLKLGVPAPVPLKGERTCVGESFEVEMRPYGSLRSRMAELPTVDLGR